MSNLVLHFALSVYYADPLTILIVCIPTFTYLGYLYYTFFNYGLTIWKIIFPFWISLLNSLLVYKHYSDFNVNFLQKTNNPEPSRNTSSISSDERFKIVISFVLMDVVLTCYAMTVIAVLSNHSYIALTIGFKIIIYLLYLSITDIRSTSVNHFSE